MKTQVYKLYKNRKIVSKHASRALNQLFKNKAKYPAIDKTVFEWFCALRTIKGTRKPLPVTRSMIKSRAIYKAKLKGIMNFKASDEWLWHWRWGFNTNRCVCVFRVKRRGCCLREADGET